MKDWIEFFRNLKDWIGRNKIREDNWNEFWGNLESKFCILILKKKKTWARRLFFSHLIMYFMIEFDGDII